MLKQAEREKILKEISDLKELINQVEEDYRKANISEKDYQELKQKYSQRIEELQEKIEGRKKEENKPNDEIEEMTPEVIERLAAQVAQQQGVEEVKSEEEVSEEKEVKTDVGVEIEKIKAMLEMLKDADKAINEKVQTLFESIGEIRSMLFQIDGSLREVTIEFERIKEEIKEIKPKKIEKKFSDINANFEKFGISIEKLEKKSEDLAKKVNKVYEYFKSVKSVKNLMKITKEIDEKLEEIKEVERYIERLAAKTEKIFIDLSKNIQEFTRYRARQEALEDELKNIIKSVDEINLKLNELVPKSDLENLRGEVQLLAQQITELNRALPLIETKLPETIEKLKEEKENVLTFLESLEEQLKSGAITIGEYKEVRARNLRKLKEINNKLVKEWKRLMEFLSKIKEAGVSELPELPAEKVKEEENKGREEEGKEEIEKKEEVGEEKEIEEVGNIREEMVDEKIGREEMVEVLKKIKERSK